MLASIPLIIEEGKLLNNKIQQYGLIELCLYYVRDYYLRKLNLDEETRVNIVCASEILRQPPNFSSGCFLHCVKTNRTGRMIWCAPNIR